MDIDLKNGVGSLTDFARNTRERAQAVIAGGKPRILTQNGEAFLVVLSVEAFEELSRQAYEHEMDLRLRDALNEYAEGDVGTPAKKALKRIRNRTASLRKGSKTGG
jgi:PHD/YefM family antitoxin component YafN of YafNO toxin-antitoxin module